MGQFAGKTALITGAASGIGKATALAFARDGARVALIDWNISGALTVRDQITAAGGVAAAAKCDVGDPGQVESAFAALTAELGSIDILFNNAGIDNAVDLVDMPLAVWDEMMRVNLRSLFLCTQAVLPGMKAKGWGRVISTASQSAYKGAPGMTHYCATKAAVLGFTRALAYEVIEDGICVNAIAPGPIDTPIKDTLPQDWVQAKVNGLPIKRFGTVDEVVPTILMLAGDGGAFYVGACLNMNGGDHMA